MPRRIAPWLIPSCLLVACSFGAGYLLLSKNTQPSEPPGASTLAPASAPSPHARPGNDSPEPAILPAEAAPGLRIPTGPEPPPRIAAVAGMICTFDATIYDLRIAPDQIARLDPDTLTKAATTTDTFQKALSALGTVRTLYRTTLTTTLDQESYTKVTNTPPNASGTFPPQTARGLTPNTTTANATSATFDLIPKPGVPGTLELDIAVKASYLLDFTPPGTINTTLLRAYEIQLHRAIIPTKPFLLFNADASTLDSSGKAVILITRVLFGPPHFAADEPAAK